VQTKLKAIIVKTASMVILEILEMEANAYHASVTTRLLCATPKLVIVFVISKGQQVGIVTTVN
jgi:hypothetical protein